MTLDDETDFGELIFSLLFYEYVSLIVLPQRQRTSDAPRVLPMLAYENVWPLCEWLNVLIEVVVDRQLMWLLAATVARIDVDGTSDTLAYVHKTFNCFGAMAMKNI